MGNADWLDIARHPLGLVGLSLAFVFGIFSRRRGYPTWWPYAAYALAFIALFGGFGLAYIKTNITASQLKCNALIGNYKLYMDYLYLNESDIKATAKSGNWKAATCEKVNNDDSFILKGEDTTEQQVEIKIAELYQPIALVETKYQSTITIDHEGSLIKRTITNPIKITPRVIRIDGGKFHKYENFIRDKLLEYEDLLEKKHSDPKTAFCYPALAKNDARTFIAAICADYARVLVKDDS